MEAFFNFVALYPLGYLALRLSAGSVFLYHGLHKAPLWKAHEPKGMTRNFLAILRIVSVSEVLGSLALIFGLFTRFASLGLSIILLGALYYKILVWKKHFTGVEGWEFDVALLGITLFLFIAGAGVLSLDWMFFHIA